MTPGRLSATEVAPAAAGFSQDRLERITAHLNRHYIEPEKIAGCQVAVARHGNVTRAAQQLQSSQPAVSKQVAELEASLGTPLFDRLPRGVQLTDAGELLRGHRDRQDWPASRA